MRKFWSWGMGLFLLASVLFAEFDFLIIDLDTVGPTGPWLYNVLKDLGYQGTYTEDTSYFSTLSNYRTLWICLGVYPNAQKLCPRNAARVEEFLENGGKLYLEGGDAFYWDPYYGGWQNINDYMGTIPLDDGTDDLGPVVGLENPLVPELNGEEWDYVGSNQWIDHIKADPSPTFGGMAVEVLCDEDQYYYTGVAYDQGTWKTFASTGQLGGYRAGSVEPESLVKWIISDFFFVDVEEGKAVQFERFSVSRTITRNEPVEVVLELTEAQSAQLSVFDVKGTLVKEIENGVLLPGRYVFHWDLLDRRGERVVPGVYFLKVDIGASRSTKKFLILP